MSRVNFTQIWSQNEEVTRLQSHLKQTLAPLLDLPIQDGVLIQDISIETTDTLVQHKLGRNYEGWIVTRLKDNAVIYESTTSNANTDIHIILKGSAACTADLYFF
jgi:hypothetical protein